MARPRVASRDLGALALAGGSVVAGIVAYVYIAVGTRQYGATAMSGVAQLWTIWFFASSVLTFPLQHWVIQRLRSDGHGGAVRGALPRLAGITLALGAAVTTVTLLARDDLFGRDTAIYPLTAGLITVGATLMGLLRGGLAGRSRFLATGLALASENLTRLAFGLLVVGAGAGVDLYGAAIASGALVILAWPSAVRFTGPATADTSPLAFLGNVAGGTVIAQSVLTGGPVMLSLIGGTPAEVTSLFVALALFRAPYIVALGVAARVTAAFTDLFVSHQWSALEEARRRMIAGGLAATVLAAGGAALIGPAVLRVVFGDEIDLTGVECAGLAAGSVIALTTLGLTLLQMVGGTGELVLRAWVIGLAAGGLAVAILPLDPLPRVVGAFLVAELAALVVMALTTSGLDRRHRSPDG